MSTNTVMSAAMYICMYMSNTIRDTEAAPVFYLSYDI